MNFRSALADNILKSIINDMQQSILLIENLHNLGYNYTFELAGTRLRCSQTKESFCAQDFIVDNIYKFDKNQADILGYVLYTLTHRTKPLKGIFTAYPVKGISCP
jgi:hypothetical protein